MKRFLSIIMIVLLVLTNTTLNVEVAFAKATALRDYNIIVTNNLTGKADKVYIFGLKSGEVVKVYNSSDGNSILAYGTVPKNKQDITFTIPQLGTKEGSVYISVVDPQDNSESSRTKASYDAEPTSEEFSGTVTITNNAQKPDTVYVSGLQAKDIVKVYDSGNKLLGSKTASSSNFDATISIKQLGSTKGTVYIKITSKNKLEGPGKAIEYSPEPESIPISEDDVTINNNAKKADTVYISNVSGGDVIKVYNSETGGKLIGSKTVASSGYDATITISQLGIDPGNIYVTVTNSECAESTRISVGYEAELPSEKPNSAYITVVNNSGKADSVYVTGLAANDIVKVYNADLKGSLLGTATVPATGNEATVSISQLGTGSGSVYISVTSTGRNESPRTQSNYSAEGRSDYISAENITVTNNVGKSDTVYVSGLSGGDTVKVYNSSSGGSLLGSATVSASGSDATVTISQLGVGSGIIYVSVTASGKLESTRIDVDYLNESKSGAPDINSISIANNAGSSDTIYITGLSAGSVVKVYSASASGYLLGSATVAAAKTDATVTISQLGTAADSVYVSVTQAGTQESGRTKVDYNAEGTSIAPNVNNISITNNVGKSDTIYISNLTGGDIVRIYNLAAQGNIIGTATVVTSETDVTVSLAQLGTVSGSVYVTVTGIGKAESKRISAQYKGESVYDEVDSANITVTNNAGTSDTVYFTRLSAGDVVKVFDSKLGGTLLGSATVASGSTDVTVSISQLGKSAGSVYVTVSSTNKSESERKEVSYPIEASTSPLDKSQIVVTNNISGTADTVFVSGLNSNDVIKVYSAAAQGTLLGTATVVSGGTSATISIVQLGTAASSVHVSVTGTGMLESTRIEASYLSEGKSIAPKSENITVNNNSGASDTVDVTGLTANDLVKVYTATTGGSLLGSATVSTYGSEVTVHIAQISTIKGSVFVTVTSTNKSESNRIEATYDSEPVSSSVTGSSITVTNNAGLSDTVKVVTLTPGDVVKVYNALSGGNLLGSETVSSSSTETTVSIPQIGTSEGKLYISITNINKAESLRTTVDYIAEAKSIAPDESKVLIVNNYGIASTVTVGNLKDNDTVNIFDAALGGTLLGSGTVTTYNSEITLSVSQLSQTGNKIYISVKSSGKLESDRTPVSYDAKAISTAPNASSVIIYNNVASADTITVIGIDPNSLLKVYTSASGGNPIGTATVPADGFEATITVTQLGVGEGSIYITVTTTGKAESNRTEVKYTAEEISDALAAGNIKVLNNSGMSDKIAITGLSEYDIVKVYNAPVGGSKLATVTADAATLLATVNISQLGIGSGSIYVTVTNWGKSESIRTEVQYEAESIATKDSNIIIVNNSAMSDTITVTGLEENDIIKVYDAASGGNLFGSAQVPSGSTTATITVTQLTTTAGKVYVSVTNKGRAESSLTIASYISEQSTIAPYIGDIYIVNNSDIDDTITVYNLVGSDVIKVYDSSTGGNLLGYATVTNNKTEATVYLEDLGTSAGVVYVSVITKGKNESSRTEASYVAVGKTTPPYSGNIYVTNNVTIADTVLVSGLIAGDKVKVYNSDTGGELLGYATAATGSTQVKVSISQLGEYAGSVFVSVTSKGKTESKRTESEFVSEQTTNEPYTGYIKVVNKAGIDDTVTISQLSAGDIIKVYSAAYGGNLLGSTSIEPDSTIGTVTITQLGASAGSIYVTVTSAGKAESNRTKVDYIAE